MTRFLRVEIEDQDTVENEVWSFTLPIDTDRHDLLNAVATLYPTYYSLHIYEVESPDGG